MTAAGLGWLVLVLVAWWAEAEQLPVRTFDSREGLAGDRVTTLYQDSHGFLWVGTDTGLSRFDGRDFITFTTESGLPHPVVRSVVEDARGRIWVGTSYGLALLAQAEGPKGRVFATLPPEPEPLDNLVYALLPEGEGVLAGLGPTLVRAVAVGDAVQRQVVARAPAPITALVRGVRGEVWVGTAAGLFPLEGGGAGERLQLSLDTEENFVTALLADDGGRVWVASRRLCAFLPPLPVTGAPLHQRAVHWHPDAPVAPPQRPGEVVCWGREAGVEALRLMDIGISPGGEVWLATTDGLVHIHDRQVEHLDERQGLGDRRTTTVWVDPIGNLWVGSERRGLMRLRRGGFVSFETADGLATSSTASVLWDEHFGVVVVGYPPGTAVHRVAGSRLDAVPVPLPPGTQLGWGRGQVMVIDRRGEWWVPTNQGLFRLPAVRRLEDLAQVRPIAVYGAASPLGSDRIFRLFQDSRGWLWIGASGEVFLARWRPADGTFVRYGAANGVPEDTPTAFAETPDGTLWVGFYRGGVGRLVGAHLQRFGEEHGLPGGFVSALLVDRRGRLWVGATRGGLGRIDDPTAPIPSCTRLTTREGLACNGVFALVEDDSGHLWVGTQRGLDRLDPATGHIAHFDTSDGLSANSITAAARAADGTLWFATMAGVSRLRPPFPLPPPPGPVRVTAMAGDGVAIPLPQAGVTALEQARFASGLRQLRITFTAVDLYAGERVRFEVGVGAGGGVWNAVGGREVNLLAPPAGTTTLLIRAVRDGQTSEPAVVRFSIPPPLWRRWWFVTLLAAAVAAGALLVHRTRVGALQRVARVRERIAADLHDELGVLCSRIALLAGVSRATELAPATRQEYLDDIAASARELLDTSAEVVWAVDTAGDTLDSLFGRVRRLGHELFAREGVSFSLVTPPEGAPSVALDGQVRREVYLMLKEALHNASRHARARRVWVQAGVERGVLAVTVEDDGCGLAAGNEQGSGRGMANLRRRAASLGGAVRWEEPPGGGTRVVLRVPLVSWTWPRRMFMRLWRRGEGGTTYPGLTRP